MLPVNSDSVFEVYYLGMVHNVNLGMNLSQKADVLLIDKVEEAQVCCQILLRNTLRKKCATYVNFVKLHDLYTELWDIMPLNIV